MPTADKGKCLQLEKENARICLHKIGDKHACAKEMHVGPRALGISLQASKDYSRTLGNALQAS